MGLVTEGSVGSPVVKRAFSGPHSLANPVPVGQTIANIALFGKPKAKEYTPC